MVHTASTFMMSVLTLYAFYRYFLRQIDFFEEVLYVHLNIEVLFLGYMFMIIYIGSAVTSKVTSEVQFAIYKIMQRI